MIDESHPEKDSSFSHPEQMNNVPEVATDHLPPSPDDSEANTETPHGAYSHQELPSVRRPGRPDTVPSASIANCLTPEDREEWREFIRGLRQARARSAQRRREQISRRRFW